MEVKPPSIPAAAASTTTTTTTTIAVGSTSGDAGLIVKLASCDNKIRNRALKRILLTWLPAQSSVSDEEMKRLWKGLFYAMWHADKTPAQADLIGRLSSLLVSLPLPLAVEYFSVFLLTLRREWPGIDNLRLDKFYLLIRRFIHSLFTMLKKNYYWDLETVTRFMGALEENAFFADDKFLTNGVNYHIASVFLEELTGFFPLKAEIIEVMFKPFISVMAKSQDKILVGKVKSNLFDVLLKMGRSLMETKKYGDENVADDKVMLLGSIGLKMGFSIKLYELGTSSDCLQGNRKVLLKLHEDFLRLEKDLASSGIEISIPEPVDDEEVPELIPISGVNEGNGNKENGNRSDKALKKNKKAEKEKEVDKASKKAKKKNKKKKDKSKLVLSNGENASKESASDEPELMLTESVISNLQKQFEKVAAEIDANISATNESAEDTVKVSKKRKRVKNTDAKGKKSNSGEEESSNIGEKSEKGAKKVSFSMKSNLVWKPHSPMPPQSLRIPPSVTPRGSALKKGVPPGPIREIPPAAKKAKLKMKRARKVSKNAPAVKRLRKTQTISV